MNDLKQKLEQKAKDVCQKFCLDRVYFAKAMGKRNHFLAGYGRETFVGSQKIALTPKVNVFIQGELSKTQKEILHQELISFIQQIRELGYD